jgi:hypothetical protein
MMEQYHFLDHEKADAKASLGEPQLLGTDGHKGVRPTSESVCG